MIHLSVRHAETVTHPRSVERLVGEPIAQYGPFVMNTEQEIYQAVADYRAGRLAV